MRLSYFFYPASTQPYSEGPNTTLSHSNLAKPFAQTLLKTKALLFLLFAIMLWLPNAKAQLCGGPNGTTHPGIIFYGDYNAPIQSYPHLKAYTQYVFGYDNTVSGIASATDLTAGSGASVVAGLRNVVYNSQNLQATTIEVTPNAVAPDFNTAIANNAYIKTTVVPNTNTYFTNFSDIVDIGSYTIGVAVWNGTTLTQLGTVACVYTGSGRASLTFTNPYLMLSGQTYEIRLYYINLSGTSWDDNPYFNFQDASGPIVPAPSLSATTKANTCPAATIDLTTITASNTPSGKVLEWHSATPATAGNKITTPSAVAAGTYYAFFYDATNNCYGPSTTVTATSNLCSAGTIDCSKTLIFTAPVAGQAGQKTLVVTVNVTTAGCFTPLTVSGSGMSLANGVTQVCTTTTGVQTFSIPVNYDGTALSTMNFTVGSAGSCSANLTTTPKKAINDIYTLECVPTVAPTLK